MAARTSREAFKGVPDLEQIFDATLILERKRRAFAKADRGAAFLMDRMAEDLSERLTTVERHFERAAAIAGITAATADVLTASGKVGEVIRLEADPAFLGDAAGRIIAGEHLPLDPESVDLAVCLLALQEANDIPGALIQIRRALRPDGLFLGAFAGAGTLSELRESLLAAETEVLGGASPRVIPFTDVRDAGGLLQRAGFALPVTDVETVTVRYDTMFGLIRRPARHGRHQRSGGAVAAAGHKAAVSAGRRDLCRAVFGPRRAYPRDVFIHLDVGMGAAWFATEAAEAGFGKGVAGQDAG